MVHGSPLPVRLSVETLPGQNLAHRFDVRLRYNMNGIGEVTVATSTSNIYAYIQPQRLGRIRTWTPWSSTCEPARRGVRAERACARSHLEARPPGRVGSLPPQNVRVRRLVGGGWSWCGWPRLGFLEGSHRPTLAAGSSEPRDPGPPDPFGSGRPWWGSINPRGRGCWAHVALGGVGPIWKGPDKGLGLAGYQP